MRTTRWSGWIVAMLAAGLVVSACGDDGGEGTDGPTDDTGGDVTGAETPADDPVVEPGDEPVDTPVEDPVDDTLEDPVDTPIDEPVGPLTVSDSACCLAASGDRVAWVDDGDVWLYDEATGEVEHLVDHPATQKDVTLSGDRLVWADDRDGTFDLWTLDLATGVAEPLAGGPGDQDQPYLAGDLLVWIGKEKPPHTSKEGDVWMLDLGDPEALPLRLTDDLAEQAHPHAAGDLVVWTDFSADPDGAYLPIDNPAENNGDILGFDLAVGAPIVVTADPSKQMRPAVDGTNVVWLDWRGINPEPKYSEFQIYATELGSGLETFVAWSSWDKPALWQRPAIRGAQVAFIAEPMDGTWQSAAFLSDVLGTPPELVAGSEGFLEAIVLREDGGLAWLGGGELSP